MSSNSSSNFVSSNEIGRWFRRLAISIGLSLWTLVAVFWIGSILGGIVFIGGVSQLGIDVIPNSAIVQLIMSVAVYVIGLLVLLVEPYAIRQLTLTSLAKLLGILRWPVIKDVGIGLLGWGCYMLLATTITILLSNYAPGINFEEHQDIGFQSLNSNLDIFYAFMLIVITAPVVEEIIFRGYLFGSIRSRLPWWFAALITSALFGLVHGQINVGIDTFILSMVLCYIREKTDSIWSGIFVHALKNAVAFYFLFLAPLSVQQLLMGM